MGIALGLIAGLLGGTADSLIMRAVDVMFSMPGLLIALVFVLVLGPGERNLIIALAVNAWMVFTRLVRGLVLAMRDGPMVEAANAVGVPQSRIMWRHILPNILGLVVTISSARSGAHHAGRSRDELPGLRHPASRPCPGAR